MLARFGGDFIGNDGEVDRAQLADLLCTQLRGRRAIGVSLGRIDAGLSGDRASARFDATLTDASGRWLADRREVLHFITGGGRECGGWHCCNAHWPSDMR